MSRRPTDRRTFLASSLAASAAIVSSGALQRAVFAAPAKKKWESLFNGTTLDGWHKNPERIGHGTGGQWTVEEGAIAGQQDPPGSGNGGILLTDRKFQDFELKIDMKPDWGVCSGLFLRGNDVGQCFQMMVDYHDAGNVGHIYGEGTTGFNTRTFDINGRYDADKKLVGLTTAKHLSAKDVGMVHSCTPEAWVKAWKVNDWNTARVRVEGTFPYITTWINGLKVSEFDGTSASTDRYDKEAIHAKLGDAGSIAVQVHGGTSWPNGAKCRWKNILIRTLS